jgi:hypothetical protein
MKKPSSKKISILFQNIIEDFENEKFNEKESGQHSGIVYTPSRIADFMVKNIFKIYFEEFFEKFDIDSPDLFLKGLNLKLLNSLLRENPKIKNKLGEKIKNFKILDPSCGSGRFLISAAKFLLKLYKMLDIDSNEYDTKKNIIQNILYGVEIEKSAYIISKIRLISWLFSNDQNLPDISINKFKELKFEELDEKLDEFNIFFNIYNFDFLLEFNLNNFDIIIGNPPYVENKKINIDYKKKLYKKFKSAYKLFDFSILFLEKSLKILKVDSGYLSFLLTNKFLSADYGIKIREILITNTELKEFINISSLPVFHKIAAYPIIISLKNKIPDSNNIIFLKKVNNLKDLINNNCIKPINLSQNLVKNLPDYVIPISGNINIINFLYSNFKPMSTAIKDLKIIYRPYGFIKWAKFFDNIIEEKDSDKDMLLIGTGNIGKFHIKFNKRIRIAKKNLNVSYFKYNHKFEDISRTLQTEKLIFREISKELTLSYDPGNFTNITGLYFIKIPSFETNKLFCLLTILNSRFMDTVFKTLFGTLHMSSGYLRFNGSFIKRLPMPNYFPQSISYLGKILQFLSQLKYDFLSNFEKELFKGIILEDIESLLEFYKNFANSLITLLYLKNFNKKLNQNFKILGNLLDTEDIFPDIEFIYIFPRYNLPKIQKEKLESKLLKLKNLFLKLNKNSKLADEIKAILQSNFL